MKLTYRGVSYEHQPETIEYEKGEIAGHYRGQDWYYRYPRHIPQLRPKLHRQYRGVTYSTRTVPFAQSMQAEESTTVENSCPVLRAKPRTIAVDETSQVHLDNIRRNLNRRLKVAKANGDDELIKLLEQESKQLALKN
ncbi:conserved hypothetical protein [Gloeothece citriformis PCC 7424]|uniref:DUF4278 domain-containing protein n=1 Tax=Gloeothece citriformis (strain PCC 7424) TaxID=65393 RepID=B7KJI2_GLOC7|nr:DUF4278 domain-containing protein [Gloeothece citriformis]ACK73659.1 conserved hypothetical protein [Gloeothece citriformis PCC 7424]